MRISIIHPTDGQDRPSREETYIAISLIISLRGTCLRGKNGCVITQENRIVATGYNGRFKGECTEKTCDLKTGCVNAVHAEENAIAFAAKQGISLTGSTLYCTSCPCYHCAKLITQAGIYKVVYQQEYRNDEGKILLQSMGVITTKLNYE